MVVYLMPIFRMGLAIFRMGYEADTKTHIVLKIFKGELENLTPFFFFFEKYFFLKHHGDL